MTEGVLPVNDLRRSWLATSAEVPAVMARVAASGWYVHGPEHTAFEAELAAFAGVRHAAGVANGTDALVLAMLGLGCGPGSEIVTVANAGGYAASAAAQVGARVVYADVAPATLLMTAETLEPVLASTTDAVVVTHLYGNVADVESIVRLCRPRGIRVIEDCAQAIGARHGDLPVGILGDVATLSFYPTKNLGGIGDGGAVLTNDPALDAAVRRLRQYGWESRYRVVTGLGRNSRLDELQAAVLRLGLRRVGELNRARAAIVGRYASAIPDGSPVRLVTGAACDTVAHLAVVRTPDRAGLRAAFETANVHTDIHYPTPDHRQEGLADPVRRTALPETERAVAEIVTIPCFPAMTEDEIGRVCRLLATFGTAAS